MTDPRLALREEVTRIGGDFQHAGCFHLFPHLSFSLVPHRSFYISIVPSLYRSTSCSLSLLSLSLVIGHQAAVEMCPLIQVTVATEQPLRGMHIYYIRGARKILGLRPLPLMEHSGEHNTHTHHREKRCRDNINTLQGEEM